MDARSLSVIICTFNGASRIRPTLEALGRCNVDFPTEIVLVDNNSNDGTAELAQRAWSEIGRQDIALRVVQEAKPGQSFARRAGILAAQGELIVFCDDDNWLNPDYLNIAAEIMRDPSIGAVGGQTEPHIDAPIPPFVFSHGQGYVLGIQALASGDVTRSRGYLWGAGLTARRADLVRLYECPGFPVLPGRIGGNLGSGDDVEICKGLVLLGRRLVYDDRLRLIHSIPASRLTIDYLSRLHAGFVEQSGGLQYYARLELLRSRKRVADIAMHGLRWLRSWRNEDLRRHYRFLFLAQIGLPAAMTEMEAAFYSIHRNLR